MATCRGTYGSNHKFADNLTTLTVTGMVFDPVKTADETRRTYTVDHSDMLITGAEVDNTEKRECTCWLEERWRNTAFTDELLDPYVNLHGGKQETLFRTMTTNQVRAVDGSPTQPTNAFF